MRSLFLLNKVASRRSSRSFENDSIAEEWDDNNNNNKLNDHNINHNNHSNNKSNRISRTSRTSQSISTSTTTAIMEDDYFQSASFPSSSPMSRVDNTSPATTPPLSRPQSRTVRKRSSFFTSSMKSFHRHHYSEDTTSSLRSTNSSRNGNHESIKEVKEEPEEQLHFSFSKMYLMNPRIRKTPSRSQMRSALNGDDDMVGEEESAPSRSQSRQEYLPQSRSTPNFQKLLRQDSNPRLRGLPISSPFHFKHLSHVDSQDISAIKTRNSQELQRTWGRATRQPTPSPTATLSKASIPPTPQSATFNRLPLRTDGPIPSPSLSSSPYSPVESMAELNRSSTRSIDSLASLYPSHLSPPPRNSSRLALRGGPEDTNHRESMMIRESILILQGTEDLPSPPISPRRKSGFITNQAEIEILQEVSDEEEEALVSPLSPPPRTSTSHSHHTVVLTPAPSNRPDTASSLESTCSGKNLKFIKQSPEIIVNNSLLAPPATVTRPASQASDTLGLGISSVVVSTTPLPPVLEQPPKSRKRMSRAPSRRGAPNAEGKPATPIEEGVEFASWEDDIDWTYDNEPSDVEDANESSGVVNDLASLFPNPPLAKSSSAPTSASASAVNLASLVSSPPPTEALPALPGAQPMSPPAPVPPISQIGVADGGFGVFDECDYDYNSRLPHQEKMKIRAARSANHIRSLSSFASLPEGHMRKRYKNTQFQEFPSLNEKEELPSSTFIRAPAGPREVAIPPASYFQAIQEAKEAAEFQGRRSRAASNATCTTLVSDADTNLHSDIDSILTPPHSNHNSAESTFLAKHAGSLRFSGKDQHASTHLSSGGGVVVLGTDSVQAIPASLRPDGDFNFF